MVITSRVDKATIATFEQYMRDEHIRRVMQAHQQLLGPGGTAKGLIARTIAASVKRTEEKS